MAECTKKNALISIVYMRTFSEILFNLPCVFPINNNNINVIK